MSEHQFGRILGGVCSFGLHLAWCPKYRRRIVGGRVAAQCGELLEQIAGEHGWEIVAKEVMPDQVRLFVLVGTTDAPASVVRGLQGRAARMPGAEFPYVRRCVKVLWSPAYFATSVGCVSVSRVGRCIEHQWDAVAS